MNDPRHASSYAHALLVEQIMALVGRSSKDPRRYRRMLESFSLPTLRRTLEELLDGALGDFPAPIEAPQTRIEAKPCGRMLPARELISTGGCQ